MKNLLLALITAMLLPIVVSGVDFLGKVEDQQSFGKVRSFCVDTNPLSGSELKDVERFIKKEDKPRRLLGKLGWKYEPDCSNADVIIKISFSERTQIELGTRTGTYQPAPTPDVSTTVIRVHMTVADKTSGKPIYSLEGGEERNSRIGAIQTAFSDLVHDVRLLTPTGSE